jgi:hypothetical protein
MTSAVLSADIQAAIATLVDADKQDPGAVGKMWDKMSVGWIDYFGEVGAWQTPTLLNSWVDFGGTYQGARYRKIGNEVEIQGLIKSGTLGANAFILPSGYRPSATLLFDAISNNIQGGFEVLSDGSVLIASIGSNVWYSINCKFGI